MDPMTDEPVQDQSTASAEWEKIRYLFQDSLLVKTSLAKLAKDMGLKWPIRGKEETPEKYIGHSLEALAEWPEFYGKGNRLEVLVSVIRESLALDTPFSDMVDHFDKVVEQQNPALQALEDLEIPADFPVELANFSNDTLSLCRAEGIGTLARFIEFAQQSAQAVIIDGDYRAFLNALTQQDVATLRQFLPVRENWRGLFLAESIGHVAGQLSDRQAASILQAYQISTTKPAWSPDKALAKGDTLDLIAEVKRLVEPRLERMPNQAQQLRHAIQSGEAARVRFFISLQDPHLEALATAAAMAALDLKPRFKGLIGRLLN
jgi:hypothetical protein